MGAVLWHGTLTAARYTLACPRCARPAAADCDEYGCTLVLCACSPPFRMPLLVGGKGHAWPVDVAGLAVEPEDFVPRSANAKRCAGVDGAVCPRAVGPRSVRCPRCVKLAAAGVYRCTVPGCQNTRTEKADRCAACAHKRILERHAERRRRLAGERIQRTRAATP